MKKYLLLIICLYTLSANCADMVPGLDTRPSKPIHVFCNRRDGQLESAESRGFFARTFCPKTTQDLDDRQALIGGLTGVIVGAMAQGKITDPISTGGSIGVAALIGREDRARWEPIVAIYEKNEEMRKDLVLKARELDIETERERIRILSEAHKAPIFKSSVFELTNRKVFDQNSHSEAWAGARKKFEQQIIFNGNDGGNSTKLV